MNAHDRAVGESLSHDANEQATAFDANRRYLLAVAYRMLGSYADAEDAVQESWFRLMRTSPDSIDDMRAWLTRVVSRICLDQLRGRARRPEHPLDRLPDIESSDEPSPLARAETADRVGYALMLVLERLTPDERLAYVLHDVFGLPFDEIAGLVERTPQAARKLASRAREKVRGGAASSPRARATTAQRRALVEAFLAAAEGGDITALVAVLHPDVPFRLDDASGGRIIRGAEAVASEAAAFRRFATGYEFEIVEIGDGFGVLASERGVPASILFFTTDAERITALEARVLS